MGIKVWWGRREGREPREGRASRTRGGCGGRGCSQAAEASQGHALTMQLKMTAQGLKRGIKGTNLQSATRAGTSFPPPTLDLR